jgi:hypothetical protein
MCQNSNDFCFENNSFAKKSQQKPAKGFLTQRRKDAKETQKIVTWSPAGFAPLRLCVRNHILALWRGDRDVDGVTRGAM